MNSTETYHDFLRRMKAFVFTRKDGVFTPGQYSM